MRSYLLYTDVPKLKLGQFSHNLLASYIHQLANHFVVTCREEKEQKMKCTVYVLLIPILLSCYKPQSSTNLRICLQ